MQIGGKAIENLPMNMVLKLLLTKKKTHKESSLNNTFENTLNKFQFMHYSAYNNNL
jgi:hypothetical protein